MATMTVSPAGSSPSPENRPLQPPARAHTNNHDRAERGLLTLLPEMQSSELRSRLPAEGGPRVGKREEVKSTESWESSVPTSSRDKAPSEGYRFISLTGSVWEEVLRLTKNPLTRPDAQEVESLNEQRGYNDIIYEKVDKYPKGYPQLSTLMYNDDTFANVRSFRLLSTRLLVQLQVELTDLEKELHKLDSSDAGIPILELRLRGNEHYHGSNTAQSDLLSKIRVKYCEYADIVMRHSQLRSLGKTTPRNHRQLLNWVMSNKPLSQKKNDFIFHADDFVSLANNPGNDRFFEDCIESYLDSRPESWVKNFLKTDVERKKTDDEYTDIYSALRLSTLARGLAVFVTVATLLVSIFLLFLVRMSRAWTATVALGFVLIFSIMISVMTSARLQDILYGTASFSAVLVAVIGNMNQGANAGN